MANMSEKELLSLFDFRPVTIGTPLEIGGASFNFFYSFHLIPCIGFEIEFKGKKIFFSGDTYYDPEPLKKKYEKGVFKKARYEFLAKRNWDQYDAIFHEAGVPPTHTPIKVLSALPDSVKEKIYVVHTSEKDVTPETGLRIAPSGINNTIILKPRSSGNSYERNLDLISGMGLFRDMPLKRIRDLLKVINEKKYKEGEVVCEKGTTGFDFFIVKSGIVKVYDDAPDRSFTKYFKMGDYFGETAITGDGKRLAHVVAQRETELISLDLYNFKWIFGPTGNELMSINTKVMESLSGLGEIRHGKYHDHILKNYFVSKLTIEQKNEINACLRILELKKDEVVWSQQANDCHYCFFIAEGEFMLETSLDHEHQHRLSSHDHQIGLFVGDFPHLISSRPCMSTVTCTSQEGAVILVFPKDMFLAFLSKNPGLFIFLKEKLL